MQCPVVFDYDSIGCRIGALAVLCQQISTTRSCFPGASADAAA